MTETFQSTHLVADSLVDQILGTINADRIHFPPHLP